MDRELEKKNSENNYFFKAGDIIPSQEKDYFNQISDIVHQEENNYFYQPGDIEHDSNIEDDLTEYASMLVTKEKLLQMIENGYHIIKKEYCGPLIEIEYEKVKLNRRRI